MTELTCVSLQCTSQVDPVRLISALSHCNRIESLCFEHGRMTDAHLCTLLPSLPLLKKLLLSAMAALTTLSFASAVPHLAQSLHTLHIHNCMSLPPSELRHLRALRQLQRQLQEVGLLASFTDPLDPDELARMTPESDRFDRDTWPNLGPPARPE